MGVIFNQKSTHTYTDPLLAAWWIQVLPASSSALRSAPFSMNLFTQCKEAAWQAKWRGVSPNAFAWFTLAPWSSNKSIISWLFLKVAWCRGVRPCHPTEFAHFGSERSRSLKSEILSFKITSKTAILSGVEVLFFLCITADKVNPLLISSGNGPWERGSQTGYMRRLKITPFPLLKSGKYFIRGTVLRSNALLYFRHILGVSLRDFFWYKKFKVG